MVSLYTVNALLTGGAFRITKHQGI